MCSDVRAACTPRVQPSLSARRRGRPGARQSVAGGPEAPRRLVRAGQPAPPAPMEGQKGDLGDFRVPPKPRVQQDNKGPNTHVYRSHAYIPMQSPQYL